MEYKKSECEILRLQSKQKFETGPKTTWLELGRWGAPHRISWMLQQNPGERRNYHITDSTHVIALRTFVAGFLEGNTSASRPWFRSASKNPDKNKNPRNRDWLDYFTNICLDVLGDSNFYHAAGQGYYDIGVFNTASYYVDEIDNGLYFHVLIPGSYYVINNTYGEAVVLVREFSLTVKALVDRYGTDNISSRAKKLYEQGTYTQMIDVVQIVRENDFYDHRKPEAGLNRKWISMSYELANSGTGVYIDPSSQNYTTPVDDTLESAKFLEIKSSRRKPFIVATSERSANFEYGEKGPTLDSLGLIKSLNKKATAKDQALELMLKPPTQGPASLRKSYVSTASNTYIPLDATSAKQGGLKPVFEINPGFGALVQDVSDIRNQVEKLYFSDYLTFLSSNPKTRTAEETRAVVSEQQLVIGPNLQSLNWTHNVPVVEFVMDWVLDKYPYLQPPPDDLAGDFLRPEFISIFAQAQKAADLPNINQFIQVMMGLAPIDPKVLDKVNLDKLADIYEDRLYLPSGLVNEQSKVDAQRQQAQMMAQRQQALQQTVPALAGAAKDVGFQMPQQEGQ